MKTLSVLARTGRWIPTPSTDGGEEVEERTGLAGRKAKVPGTRQQHPATATHESSLNSRFRLDDDDGVGGKVMVDVGRQLDSGAGMTRSRLRLCLRRPTWYGVRGCEKSNPNSEKRLRIASPVSIVEVIRQAGDE